MMLSGTRKNIDILKRLNDINNKTDEEFKTPEKIETVDTKFYKTTAKKKNRRLLEETKQKDQKIN